MSNRETTSTLSSSSSSDTIIHHLPVDLLVAIFARLGLCDLCMVEQGSNAFSYVLFVADVFISNGEMLNVMCDVPSLKTVA